MASKLTIIARYLLIINRLKNRKQSLQQLNHYLQIQSEIRGYDCSIKVRTFQRELKKIRELFGVDIRNDRSEHVYYIFEETVPVLQHQDRIIESYEILNILEASDLYKEKIFFESRKSNGLQHIFGILHAIKNNFIANTEHINFPDGSLYSKSIKPFAIKESQGRWYVLAEDIKDSHLKTFALDRISDLDITKQKFEKPEVNIEEWFKYSFGIMNAENEKPAKIKLSFSFLQGQYIKSFPLHKSQQVIFENYDEDEVTISLEVFITDDLIMELMKYGNELKVLAPEFLAEKMKEEHKKAFEQY